MTQLREFLVETWLNPRCPVCKYNLGSSGIQSVTVKELFGLIGQDVDGFLETVRDMDLHYGHFFGLDRLKKAIARLYRKQDPELVLTVHGGTGANHMVLAEFTYPDRNVVAIVPNYQQHYSIPESLGAEVRYVWCRVENGYMPDLDELRKAVDGNTSMITLANPSNPTGAFIEGPMMKEICAIADKVGAVVLCDEIYRGLRDDYMPSAMDFYDKAVVTSSMSKVWSMAGTRVGWICTNDPDIHKRLETRRSYDTICGGVFDELISAIAIENEDAIFRRNRAIFRKNREIVREWLKDQPRLSGPLVDTAPISFFAYDGQMNATEFGEALYAEKSLVVCHGDCFDVPKSFRLGFGYIKEDVLRAALAELGDFLKNMK